MRRHTLVGDRILAASPALRTAGTIVRWTHERWDGSGYPDGLSGQAIPLAARVIAACNAFVALQEQRPYRAAMTREAALATLRGASGGRFDPALLEIAAVIHEHPGEVVRNGWAPSSSLPGFEPNRAYVRTNEQGRGSPFVSRTIPPDDTASLYFPRFRGA